MRNQSQDFQKYLLVLEPKFFCDKLEEHEWSKIFWRTSLLKTRGLKGFPPKHLRGGGGGGADTFMLCLSNTIFFFFFQDCKCVAQKQSGPDF